jgi:pimeloyl-ACP methyl ester carboxylesterase
MIGAAFKHGFMTGAIFVLGVNVIQAGVNESPGGSMRYVQGALVHTLTPAEVTREHPVVMVPGHNLSGSIYLRTPDGREGWAGMFVAAGYVVHVINDPRFDFSRDPDVPKLGQPPHDPEAPRPWSRDVWPRWGFGIQRGEAYPNAQFPTEAFARFEADYPWVGTVRRDYTLAIVALLQEVGPAVLMAHSAGGPKTVDAAMQRPDLIEELILIEPTGPPTEANFPTLSGKSMLGVYGDYIALRGQGGRKDATIRAAELFEQHGGDGDILDLVEDRDISGNSHLMMQDTNNEFIASQILRWLANHDAKGPPWRRGMDGMGGRGKRGKGKGRPFGPPVGGDES